MKVAGTTTLILLLTVTVSATLAAMGSRESELLGAGRFAGVHAIEVDSDSFDLNVLGTSSARTSVEVVGSSSVRVSLRQGGSTLYIAARDRRAIFSRSGAPGRIDIQTFEGVALEADVGSGDVDLRGFQGSTIDVDTGSGRIEARALFGEVAMRTGSGSLRMERVGGMATAQSGSGSITLIDGEGRIRLATGSGALTLEAVRGDIEASSGSGLIAVDAGEGRFNLSTGGGSIEATAVNPRQDSRFSTGSGDIVLAIAGDVGRYSFDLESTSGMIYFDGVSVGRRLERSRPGPRISAESSTGSITVGGDSFSQTP